MEKCNLANNKFILRSIKTGIKCGTVILIRRKYFQRFRIFIKTSIRILNKTNQTYHWSYKMNLIFNWKPLIYILLQEINLIIINFLW